MDYTVEDLEYQKQGGKPTPTPGPERAPGHSRQPAPPSTAATTPDNPAVTWPISEQPTQVIPPTTPPER